MLDTPERISDLQYAILCGLTPDSIAARTGSTPTKIREELAATPMPPWLIASVKQMWATGRGDG